MCLGGPKKRITRSHSIVSGRVELKVVAEQVQMDSRECKSGKSEASKSQSGESGERCPN